MTIARADSAMVPSWPNVGDAIVDLYGPPLLVLAVAFVFSLEVLQHRDVAKNVSAVALISAWSLLLPPSTQVKAVASGTIAHIIDACPKERSSGLKAFVDSDWSRKATFCQHLALRVCAWGAAWAASELAVLPMSVRLIVPAVYVEMTEWLLLWYFWDASPSCRWRRRGATWSLSCALATLQHLGLIDHCIPQKLNRRASLLGSVVFGTFVCFLLQLLPLFRLVSVLRGIKPKTSRRFRRKRHQATDNSDMDRNASSDEDTLVPLSMASDNEFDVQQLGKATESREAVQAEVDQANHLLA